MNSVAVAAILSDDAIFPLLVGLIVTHILVYKWGRGRGQKLGQIMSRMPPLASAKAEVRPLGIRHPEITPELIAHVRPLIEAGELIEAIKIVREQTGLGLKEAKDAVEAMRH